MLYDMSRKTIRHITEERVHTAHDSSGEVEEVKW